jgi:glycosyltransferase involved in cell wall biosynthesis
MASGVAVLATRVGGNAELVKTEKTGILLPPEDPEVMATVLLSYVTNPRQAKDQGRAGREQVEKEFSVKVMVEKYLAVYDSLPLS